MSHPIQRDGDGGRRAPEPAPFDPERRVVAVTGAHSHVGSALLDRLEADPRYAKLLALDIRKPAALAQGHGPGAWKKTRYHKVDLTLPTADADLAEILRREGVDTFVHAAFLSTPTHNSGWAHE